MPRTLARMTQPAEVDRFPHFRGRSGQGAEFAAQAARIRPTTCKIDRRSGSRAAADLLDRADREARRGEAAVLRRLGSLAPRATDRPARGSGTPNGLIEARQGLPDRGRTDHRGYTGAVNRDRPVSCDRTVADTSPPADRRSPAVRRRSDGAVLMRRPGRDMRHAEVAVRTLASKQALRRREFIRTCPSAEAMHALQTGPTLTH